MTPAINVLTKANIPFKLHEYSHDPKASSYGNEAVECLNANPDQVFKTLVISTDASDNTKQLAIAIVPVSHNLDHKGLAKSLKTKKSQMADPTAAQNTTGYILGGISPFGQKKRLPFRLDDSAQNFNTIFVSGGKRGLEIEISPTNLIQVCSACYADIKKSG